MNKLQSSLLKKGKKGFTLTELAIVIAVIAILIAVLVPTFTSVINKANVTTAAENAHNALTEYTIETYDVLDDDSKAVVKAGDYYFTVTEDGTISTDDAYVSKTDNTSGLVAYTWTDSTFAGYGIATIYVSNTYVDENADFAGFVATATSASEAAISTITVSADAVYYTAVTLPGGSAASYWFKHTYTLSSTSWAVEAIDEDDYTTPATNVASEASATMTSTNYSSYGVKYKAPSA